MPRAEHYLDGKNVPKPEPALFTSAAVSILTGYDPHRAYSFTTVSRAETWIAKQPFADAYSHHQELVRRARLAERRADEGVIEAHQKSLVARLRRSIGSRLRAEAVDAADVRAVDRAMAAFNPVMGPIIHSAILYQFNDYAGRWLPIPSGAAYPKLSWFDFNDRTSSIRVSGTLTLHQHTWFRGAQRFSVGIPYQGFPRLSDFGFDNCASSAVSGGGL